MGRLWHPEEKTPVDGDEVELESEGKRRKFIRFNVQIVSIPRQLAEQFADLVADKLLKRLEEAEQRRVENAGPHQLVPPDKAVWTPELNQ